MLCTWKDKVISETFLYDKNKPSKVSPWFPGCTYRSSHLDKGCACWLLGLYTVCHHLLVIFFRTTPDCCFSVSPSHTTILPLQWHGGEVLEKGLQIVSWSPEIHRLLLPMKLLIHVGGSSCSPKALLLCLVWVVSRVEWWNGGRPWNMSVIQLASLSFWFCQRIFKARLKFMG